MSPEQLKGYVDIVVSLMGAGGVGAIALAILGIWKGRQTPALAPADRPALGPEGMAHLGGMLAGQYAGMEWMQMARRAIDVLERSIHVRENDTRIAREIADERHTDTRKLTEAIERLADRTRAAG